jgi:hypothetical protein
VPNVLVRINPDGEILYMLRWVMATQRLQLCVSCWEKVSMSFRLSWRNWCRFMRVCIRN